MSDAQFPWINDTPTSWANFLLKIKGGNVEFTTPDFFALKWEDKVSDVDAAYGQGPLPRFRPAGRYDPGTVDIGIYHSAWAKFEAALATAATALGLVRSTGEPRLSLVHFDISGKWEPYSVANADAQQQSVMIQGCRYVQRGMDLKSDDGNPVGVPIQCTAMQIKANGNVLL